MQGLGNIRKPIWILPILLTVLVYGISLRGELVFDDSNLFHTYLPRLKHYMDAFLFQGLLPVRRAYYRPLWWLLLMALRDLFGYSIFGFHVVSLFFQAVNGSLVYFIALHFFNLKEKRGAQQGALLTALFFAVYPLHTEVVAWVSSGTVEGFCSVLVFSSFLFFLYYQKNPERYRWALLSGLAFLAAILVKETALMLFFVFIAYDFIFLRGSASKKRFFLYGFIIFSLFLYGILRLSQQPTASLTYFKVSSLKNLLTNLLGTFGYYAQKILMPYPRDAYVSEIPGSKTFLVWSAFALGGFVFMIFKGFKRDKTLFFHLLFFLLMLSPSALIAVLQVSATPLAERYLYISSYAFCFLLGSIFLPLRDAKGILKKRKVFLLGGLLLLFGSLSFWDTRIWKNNESFWSYAAARNPKAIFPLVELARWQIEKGKYPQALAFLTQAFDRSPRNRAEVFYVFNTFGDYYDQMNQFSAAEESYRKALEVYPHPNTYYRLGRLYKTWADKEPHKKELYTRLAKESYEKLLTIDPHGEWADEARSFLEGL